ncbi:MAG: phage tail sheath family protein [Anaerolineae bacterium]|nr:phage tail sheath family protein [Anaerolineae bacterium]
MPQYLSPGVYVEEVPSGLNVIAGVSTSVAGFVGRVADNVTLPPIPGKFEKKANSEELDPEKPIRYSVADVGEPYLVTSWDAFKTRFGDFQAGNSVLAHAVYGFFNNGGTRCWVARVNSANLTTKGVQDTLATFEAIDEISLVIVPGASEAATQQATIDHCAKMGDRFAILDGQEVPNAYTPALVKGAVSNSDYAAMYFPYIQVYDPASDDLIYVPPSGHMAGVYARVDGQRGVHKAPANEPIRGAVGLEWKLSKADQDGLNPAGINVIREMNGRILVWGARTLGGDANGEWKYVNVRRLFLYLRESLDEGTQWVVFEPNDRNLWAKIRLNVTAFLSIVWKDGALFGSSPAEAFYVRCDDTNNPAAVRDLGQVITEIGVAVNKPAEFVIFRISQWAGPSAT